MTSDNNGPSRDEIAERYLDQLPYEPYPVQEEALFAWFAAEQGVLVCAPTGTGKTLIAEAALFEALHEGRRAYYTTPLIALTEQKYQEMQDSAVRWGFSADDVGLVTGNRQVNPGAKILVVVAEILFNRLIHREAYEFDDVSAVVMDEFHSFNDRERGIVWEFTLGLLPEHVRTLLLSATVGNSREFIQWLKRSHNRKLELVQGDERKVPLTFNWIGDMLLTEQIEFMAKGDDEARTTPSLIFCFNREECWNVAEQLKGKKMLAGDQQARLAEELKGHDWSKGAGPKLRQILQRGVGVHHAGILPKYRRIVEDLFQRKLLSVATCTETLAAGINLPARSVVVPNILKGPPGKKRILESSTAHQIFGRAGRPQFDDRGHVFVLAHEDDVKISRWKDQYDQIPEKTKDPGLMKAKKRLKKKMPKRRSTVQYWNKEQFDKLCAAEPGNLSSRGTLPWRLLAHILNASPEVETVRKLVGKRLMDSKHGEKAQESLENMLMTLWRAGYVTLEPEPPKRNESADADDSNAEQSPTEREPTDTDESGNGNGDGKPKSSGLFGSIKLAKGESLSDAITKALDKGKSGDKSNEPQEPIYRPEFAHPTPEMQKLLQLRGVNPLYGIFLINHMGIADRNERIQAMESVLELPSSVGYHVHVPNHDQLPPGPLATMRLDEQLLRLGLATAEELTEQPRDEADRYNLRFGEERVFVLSLAEKLRRLFNYDFPGVHDVRTGSVWAAGELLEFGGDFNNYITSKKLQKQEGVIFRHLLRLILLIAEFAQFTPPDTTEEEWRGDLHEISAKLSESCRQIDPSSTEKALEQAAHEQASSDEGDSMI